MTRSAFLKCLASCLVVFGWVLLQDGKAFALPYAVIQTFAAAFCVYHLRKYRPQRKAVVVAILVSEVGFSAAYYLALLHTYDLTPSFIDAARAPIYYLGLAAMPVAAFSLLVIRRPLRYEEGALDFVVAIAAISMLQWELHGRGGAAAQTVLSSFIVPVCCSLVFVGGVGLLWRLFVDTRMNRVLVAGQTCAVVLSAIGNVGFSHYGDPLVAGTVFTATWPGAFITTGGWLLCLTLLHPDSPAEFQREEGLHNRLSIMRWLGPALALVTNPVMFGFLLYRSVAPSLPLVACSVALTVLVIWRIQRLLMERESARLRSELGEKRLQSLVEYAADVIVVTKAGGEITYVSPGIHALTGIAAEMAVGMHVQTFVAHDDVERMSALMHDEDAHFFEQDVALQRVDGTTRWVSIKAIDHRADPSVQGWVWNVHDITDRKLSEEAMSRLALYDQLTGLPNRTQMRDRLESYLRDSRNVGEVAVLFCDLDGFKDVNDVLGHDAGDDVLKAVAGRWSSVLRGNDVLGRWGGDEFLVICPVDSIDTAKKVADRLVASLTEPLDLAKGQATVGCSIGVVMGQQGEDIDALLRRADDAMYVAKRTSVPLHIA